MKQTLIACAVAFVVGAALTKYYWPTVTTKIEVQEKEVLRTDIKTVTRTIERRDGTKETTTETVDKSVQKLDRSTQIVHKAEPKWIFGITGESAVSEFEPHYGLQVSRRVFGPFFAGVTANTKAEFGLVLQAQF